MNKDLKKKGFSLIEVIIGLAILFMIISFIIVAIKGRETESRRSTKYFNAVFLAQKIIDDLDNRCRENIYTVEQLARSNSSFQIVEGEDPFFKYLEDTNSDGKTNNDNPIDDQSGTLFSQFKDYQYKFIINRNYKNGLAKVKIVIKWVDKGQDHEYELNQILPDLPNSIESDVGNITDVQVNDDMIYSYLFMETEPLDELLKKYSLDKDVALNLVKIQYISRAAAKSIMETEQKILQIKNSSAGKTVDGILKLAKYREENAVKIIQCYSMLAIPFSELKDKQSRFSRARFDLNDKTLNMLKDFSRIAKVVDGKKNKDSFALKFNIELAEAMNLYVNLLTSKNLGNSLPYNRKVGALVKVIDLGSALIQNNFERMIFSIGSAKITLTQLVQNSFKTLHKILEGRDYNRASYVSEKIKTINSGKFREYEDISERLSNMYAVSDLSGDAIQSIRKSMKKWAESETEKE